MSCTKGKSAELGKYREIVFFLNEPHKTVCFIDRAEKIQDYDPERS
jgi:beta-galactosidase beta subunit